MSQIVAFLAPPVVGAFIGYMTNYVAIRMLFRPLRPWYLLGMKLPMTPGVIPAKRHKLAKNIGEMVGEHLLTSKEVGEAISGEGFQQDLRAMIEGRLEEILSRDLGPVLTMVPERFRSQAEAGLRVLRWRFLKYLHNHLDSPVFGEKLAEAIASQLEAILARELNASLPEKTRERFYSGLEDITANFLSGPEVKDWLQEYIDQKTESFLANGGCLKDLLPEAMTLQLLMRLEEEAPPLLQKLAAYVEEPVVQDRIARGITKAIGNFIDALGPFAALAGSILNPEAIDLKVRNYLGEKSGDISKWLFDETVQQKIAEIIKDKAGQFVATPLTDLLRDVPPEKINEVRGWFASLATATLERPETAAAFAGLVRDGLETQTQRPLSDILTGLFGADGLDQGKRWTTEEIIAVIRSPKVKRMIDKLVVELLEEKLLNQPVGPLSDLLPRAIQDGLADYLLQQTNALLVREVPGLLDSLNIRNIVAEKVDSLDLLRLEKLLLSIMEEQFKYINLFGGLLGFLIGLVNLAFL